MTWVQKIFLRNCPNFLSNTGTGSFSDNSILAWGSAIVLYTDGVIIIAPFVSGGAIAPLESGSAIAPFGRHGYK
jgi:hypothetical protein